MSNRFKPTSMHRPADTKKVRVNGITVTCVKVDSEGWCFDTGVGNVRFVWRWEDRHSGTPNMGMNQESGYSYQMYFANLEAAVNYAFGFTYGWWSRGNYDRPSSPTMPMGTKVGDT